VLVEQNSLPQQIEGTEDGFVEDMEVDEEENDENDEEAMLLAEREQQQAKIVMEVANLQDEISTKERLILELEQSERRMAQVRRDYERKLHELSERIAATESERDKILLEMSKKSNSKLTDEKIREIKQDYEKRLGALRTDFNKMKSIQSEHERARQRQAAQQQELMRTRRELDDMKRSKVKLVQKMRDNAKKVKKTETDLANKLSNLEKNSRLEF
jgi:kinesin family protein 4/21/27